MRRKVLAILILVLLGALVNVAVAWGCALGPEYVFDPPAQWTNERSGRWIEGMRTREATEADLRWLGTFGWEPQPIDDWMELTAEAYGVESFGREDNVWFECEGLTTETVPMSYGLPHPHIVVLVVQVRTGWPLRCLSGDRWRVDPRSPTAGRRYAAGYRYVAAIPLEELAPARLIMPLREQPVCLLPFRPIWPGFAVNTLLYAAVVWLLWLMPLAGRRVNRIKRGQCPKCGYDLQGELDAGCPECGWKRENAGEDRES